MVAPKTSIIISSITILGCVVFMTITPYGRQFETVTGETLISNTTRNGVELTGELRSLTYNDDSAVAVATVKSLDGYLITVMLPRIERFIEALEIGGTYTFQGSPISPDTISVKATRNVSRASTSTDDLKTVFIESVDRRPDLKSGMAVVRGQWLYYRSTIEVKPFTNYRVHTSIDSNGRTVLNIVSEVFE